MPCSPGKALAVAVLASLALAPDAQAATVSTTFSVTATVLASCNVSAGTLAFGSYSPASPTDATSAIDVVCTNGTTYTVALDGGSTASNVAARAMNDTNSHTLGYGIYTNATRATVWGDGTGSTITQSGTGNGATQALTAYGRVPASQFAAAGNYSDTITVTVTY